MGGGWIWEGLREGSSEIRLPNIIICRNHYFNIVNNGGENAQQVAAAESSGEYPTIGYIL